MDFFEQPVTGKDLIQWWNATQDRMHPIGVDEGIHNIDDIKIHHDRKAANGGSLKMIKFGGVRNYLKLQI
ncbi:MAG: hypothetical protein CM15mP73_1280 [Hyphomicrobiales bacterium]|nr:MAG: hypothetical protein CM15mP73_1280 [Hyphomicrobiales bacterium]